jgi:molybdopterin molybdotransferase
MLSYADARALIIESVAARGSTVEERPLAVLGEAPPHETVSLECAIGRTLAESVASDRDYPPFDRATRDGFAVRSADLAQLPVTLALIGEIRAGGNFPGGVRPGQCIQIMTGAAVPPGADAVVMIEHTKPSELAVVFDRTAFPEQNVVRRGTESRAGEYLLVPGIRLGYAELSLAAQVGRTELCVRRRPVVAILSTGDEIVSPEDRPGPHQIRNSNSVSLGLQARLAGAEPRLIGNSPDQVERLRAKIMQGLESDVLVLTGGVSMGKYDLVEGVLRDLGAEFLFDAVAIRPGRPAVFAYCQGRPVFGLPGNPVSTMVTFELLVVPALDILGGSKPRPLPIFKAKLAAPVRQTAVVTHFLPAELTWTGGEATVRELPWQGSGDIVTMARANCFLVVPETRLELAAGEWVDVVPRRDRL